MSATARARTVSRSPRRTCGRSSTTATAKTNSVSGVNEAEFSTWFCASDRHSSWEKSLSDELDQASKSQATGTLQSSETRRPFSLRLLEKRFVSTRRATEVATVIKVFSAYRFNERSTTRWTIPTVASTSVRRLTSPRMEIFSARKDRARTRSAS